MNKMKKAFEKNKKYLILFLILWIVLEIVLIAPMAVAIAESASAQGQFELANFIENFGKEVSSFTAITRIGSAGAGSAFGKGTLWLTILCLVVTAIGIIKSKPKNNYEDIENGSSDWCEGGEQYRILNKNKGIILAEDNYLPVDKRGNVNVLVVGGSGSGKSASYSIPNAYQMLGSYVFTDPKGELYDKTSGFLKQNGYDIKVLNLVKPQNSDGYNPLHHITSEIDVDVIANTIVKGQKTGDGGADPFWDDSAEMLLKALIYYLMATRPEEEQNFSTLLEFINASETREEDEEFKNAVDLLFEELERDEPNHFAVRQYKKYKLAAGKTAKSILISCGARLAPFDIAELRELTSYDEMELDMVGDQRTALFIVISDTDDTFNFVVAMMYSQLFNLLCDRADDVHHGRLPYHVRILCDEFANIGQIPKFDKLIATIRSREISASIILQSQSQLKTIYKDAAETITGNCDTMLFLGGKESTTLKEISETLGKETIDLYNTSDTRGQSRSYGLNYQKTGKELMSRDELAVMDGSKCILQLRGVRPFLSDKFDITKHKRYKELSDFDKKNEFDVECYLKHELRLLTTEEFDLYEVDVTEQAQG